MTDIRGYISANYPTIPFTPMDLIWRTSKEFPDIPRRTIKDKVWKCLKSDEMFHLVRRVDLEAYYLSTHTRATVWVKR